MAAPIVHGFPVPDYVAVAKGTDVDQPGNLARTSRWS